MKKYYNKIILIIVRLKKSQILIKSIKIFKFKIVKYKIF